jgi:hypothetical protein
MQLSMRAARRSRPRPPRVSVFFVVRAPGGEVAFEREAL